MHNLDSICIEKWQPVEKDARPAKACGPVPGANCQDEVVKCIENLLAGVNHCYNRGKPTWPVHSESFKKAQFSVVKCGGCG
jgi:hypothetical protein